MNEKQQQDFVDILLRKKPPPQPKLSEADRFVEALLEAVRKQKPASGAHLERIIRGG